MTIGGGQNRYIVCRQCQKHLENALQPKDPCPSCGSTLRDIAIEIVEELSAQTFEEQLKGKIKAPHKKKPSLEFITGEEPSSKPGTPWVRKQRLIDRTNKRYKEKVVDSKTGEVIRDVDEPLSDHTGHGSDRQ